MRAYIANLKWRHIFGGCALVLAATVTAVSPVQAKASGPNDSAIASHAARANVAAVSSVVFGGATSQGWPVVFSISTDYKRLLVAEIGLDMGCTSGVSIAAPAAVVNLRFRRNGTISSVKTISPFTGPQRSITGGSQSITVRLNRKRQTLSGTWHLHLDFASPSGQTDHCDSGVIRFAARL